jgi:hypothetical protein
MSKIINLFLLHSLIYIGIGLLAFKNTDSQAISFFLIFVMTIIFFPAFILLINYIQVQRRSQVYLQGDSNWLEFLTLAHRAGEINKVHLHISANKNYGWEFRVLIAEEFDYAKIELNNGTIIFLNCLMMSDIKKQLDDMKIDYTVIQGVLNFIET